MDLADHLVFVVAALAHDRCSVGVTRQVTDAVAVVLFDLEVETIVFVELRLSCGPPP